MLLLLFTRVMYLAFTALFFNGEECFNIDYILGFLTTDTPKREIYFLPSN